jgi:iron(III) transport system permease protein
MRLAGRQPFLLLAVCLIGALFAAPLGYLLVRNLSEGGAFWSTLAERSTLEALGRSLILAVAVSAACALIGGGAAWLVVRSDLPGRRAWRLLLPLPLVIPSFIGAFALIAAFSPGGLLSELLGTTSLPSIHGFPGAFAVLTLLSYPFVFLPVAARLLQLPRNLEESALLLGRRPAAVFARVVFPQVRGALAAGTLLVFLYTLSDFGAVQLLRYDTLTREIYATRLLDPATSLALSLQLGVLALVVVFAGRILSRSSSPAARIGGPARLVPLGPWKAPAVAAVALLTILALVAPVAVLCYWALRGLVRGSTRASALVTDAGSLLEPLGNTAAVSLAAAVVAVVVVLPIAYLVTTRRSAIGEVANGLVVSGFALPGLVTALALVFWTLNAPGPLGALYQTLPLLVIAYVLHFAAQSMRTASVAVANVPPRLVEAARTLGVSRARRFRSVELPLMAPPLIAGGGLVLLSAMKELPATLLLAPAGFQTLATKIWVATEDAFLADASLASLVLIALSGVLTWVFVIRRAAAVS